MCRDSIRDISDDQGGCDIAANGVDKVSDKDLPVETNETKVIYSRTTNPSLTSMNDVGGSRGMIVLNKKLTRGNDVGQQHQLELAIVPNSSRALECVLMVAVENIQLWINVQLKSSNQLLYELVTHNFAPVESQIPLNKLHEVKDE